MRIKELIDVLRGGSGRRQELVAAGVVPAERQRLRVRGMQGTEYRTGDVGEYRFRRWLIGEEQLRMNCRAEIGAQIESAGGTRIDWR